MNKDVVYIEPEDDITDIITKIENAKEKIVALVPPKKTAVLRSIVNIKLIAKAGANAEKTVVLVTTDPSIVKLAAATRIPVTKNLKSAPAVPEMAEEVAVETESTEELVENDDETEVVDGDSGAGEGDSDETDGFQSDAEVVLDDEGVEVGSDGASRGDEGSSDAGEAEQGSEEKEASASQSPDKQGKKAKKAKNKTNPDKNAKKFSKAWFLAYRKVFIGAGCGLVALILLLVWMFGIAPRVEIELAIRTTTANFSENVTFTSKLEEENAEAGKFYLTEKKIESPAEVEFEATGKKNVGEKAKGKVQIYSYLEANTSVAVPAGSMLTYDGKVYTTAEATSLAAGDSITECQNTKISEIQDLGCLIYGSVAVTASEGGSDYNVDGNKWKINVAGVAASTGATTGGTDEYVTVVSQEDVDKAKEKITATNSTTNKEKLLADVDEDDEFVIESSYKQVVGDATSSPAVGEEVKSGAKAKLSVVTTDSIYVIDRVKVEEFIREKAKLADNFKIYNLNNPFVENFVQSDNGWSGKLKASYVSGPEVTAAGVLDIAKGKPIGTAKAELSDIDGVKSVTITTSFPWVSSVPNDDNRVTVKIDDGEE